MNPSPDLVAIGHVTWDVLPDDLEARKAGGAVAFAAVTAARFGIQAAMVTSCAADYPLPEVLASEHSTVRVPSAHTSTFENRYDHRGDRVQVLHRRGGDISIDAIPEAWRSPNMLFVGPLTQELPVDCLSWFRPRVSCVVPQGWLRSWDQPMPSTVEVTKSPPAGMSAGWDICVVSESEVEPRSLGKWRELSRCLVVTKGGDGADLYTDEQNEPLTVPSFAGMVNEAGTDTTGAGDVFAAAMLIRYAATGDAEASAEYASACAALSTRAPSWSAVEEPMLAMLGSTTR